jgi:hypothetical protein
MLIQLFLYVTFIALGYSVPATEPIVLISMGMLLLGVVCASLIIPFGGLDKKTERIPELVLQYGPIAFIGWHIGNTAAFIGHRFDLAIVGSTVFMATILLSYWRASYHSREYRFGTFLSISHGLPIITRTVFSLRIRKFSALADEMILAIAEKNPLPRNSLREVGVPDETITKMEQELLAPNELCHPPAT